MKSLGKIPSGNKKENKNENILAEAISSRKGRRELSRSMVQPLLGRLGGGKRVDLSATACSKCAFVNIPCEDVRTTIGQDCWMAAGELIIVWEERDYESVESV